jgi:hypothetical protein
MKLFKSSHQKAEEQFAKDREHSRKKKENRIEREKVQQDTKENRIEREKVQQDTKENRIEFNCGSETGLVIDPTRGYLGIGIFGGTNSSGPK